jgi:hypothetical protein
MTIQIKKKLGKASGTIGAIGLMGVVTIFSANPSQAVVVNGSFENNFNGWTTIGQTNIRGSGFGSGPTDGNRQALIRNGGDSVGVRRLENFLGLALGSLNSLGNGQTTQGSAIKQTFSANAGDVLTFDWNFLTNEESNTTFNDFAFVAIASLQELADTATPSVSSVTNFARETGFKNFSYTFASTGNYTLGLGVVDVGDTIVNSGLLVDNVNVKTVPEPFTILGSLVAGSFGVVLHRKRKQQKDTTM